MAKKSKNGTEAQKKGMRIMACRNCIYYNALTCKCELSDSEKELDDECVNYEAENFDTFWDWL